VKKNIIAITQDNFHIALPLLQELHGNLSEAKIKDRFLECHKDNHCLFAWLKDENCIAIAGYRIDIKIYSGKFMYIDNLCVESSHRSSGIGKEIIRYLEDLAKQKQCEKCILDTYTSNKKSHKFYFREGYEIWGFHFVKKI
jgi:diamine N-acetyltransferase